MSRKLGHLTQNVGYLAEKVQGYCAARGVTLLIYCTRRTFVEQGELFRKGRSRAEIEAKIADLEKRGFHASADAIRQAGPQTGKKVTKAAPGESWHNYGLAFDAVPMENTTCLWSYTENREKWDVYAEALSIHGLAWGGNFSSFKDYPHAQFRSGNPLSELTTTEIEEAAAWVY